MILKEYQQQHYNECREQGFCHNGALFLAQLYLQDTGKAIISDPIIYIKNPANLGAYLAFQNAISPGLLDDFVEIMTKD